MTSRSSWSHQVRKQSRYLDDARMPLLADVRNWWAKRTSLRITGVGGVRSGRPPTHPPADHASRPRPEPRVGSAGRPAPQQRLSSL